jgi:hypothetical protein
MSTTTKTIKNQSAPEEHKIFSAQVAQDKKGLVEQAGLRNRPDKKLRFEYARLLQKRGAGGEPRGRVTAQRDKK